jgi:hypothetical protein
LEMEGIFVEVDGPDCVFENLRLTRIGLG